MGLLDRCVENIQPVNSEDLDIDEVIKVLTLNEHEKRTLTNLSLIYDSAVKMLEELKEFRSLGIIPEQMREISEMYRELATELGKYKKAEEQGLLIMLPCKEGDMVYGIEIDCNRDTLGCHRWECEKCDYLIRHVSEIRFGAEMRKLYSSHGKKQRKP